MPHRVSLRTTSPNFDSTAKHEGELTLLNLTNKAQDVNEVNLLILDFAAVDFIDSMGLGSLVNAFMTVRNKGGELKLLNLQEKVAHVMQITKLYTVLDILNDEAAAVKTFSQATARA